MIVGQLQPQTIQTGPSKQQESDELDFCEVRNSSGKDDELSAEILLDTNISASMVRPEVFRTGDMPEFNEFESKLQQLYRIGD